MRSVMDLVIGDWAGHGNGEYPTITSFAYREQLSVTPVPGKPFAIWRSATQDAGTGEGRHLEIGFLRPTPDGGAELLLTHGSGLAEIAVAGPPADGLIEFRSTVMAGAPTAKEVTEVVRRFQRVGDIVRYDLAMAAVGLPLTHHLRAELRADA